jgi:hypothetical protein
MPNVIGAVYACARKLPLSTIPAFARAKRGTMR